MTDHSMKSQRDEARAEVERLRARASRYEAALRAGIEMAEVVMEQAKLTPPSGSSQIEWERRIDDVEEWLFAARAALSPEPEAKK